jgi:hypothetical protein
VGTISAVMDPDAGRRDHRDRLQPSHPPLLDHRRTTLPEERSQHRLVAGSGVTKPALSQLALITCGGALNSAKRSCYDNFVLWPALETSKPIVVRRSRELLNRVTSDVRQGLPGD